jgi:archaellum component FlaC
MSVVAFDTLKFAQTLRDKAKLTSEQAEGISQAFADAVSEQIATKSDFINLATKQDLADLKKQDLADLDKKISGAKDDVSDLKKDISGLKMDISDIHRLIADTNTKIVESKAETLKWVIGLSMAQIAAMFALFRLLPGGH